MNFLPFFLIAYLCSVTSEECLCLLSLFLSHTTHTHTRAHTHTRTTPPHVRHQCFLQPQLLLLGSATVWSSQNHLYHVFNDLTFTETFLCALLLHSAFHLTCRTMLRDGMTIINPLLQMTKLRPQRGQVICLRSHS